MGLTQYIALIGNGETGWAWQFFVGGLADNPNLGLRLSYRAYPRPDWGMGKAIGKPGDLCHR